MNYPFEEEIIIGSISKIRLENGDGKKSNHTVKIESSTKGDNYIRIKIFDGYNGYPIKDITIDDYKKYRKWYKQYEFETKYNEDKKYLEENCGLVPGKVVLLLGCHDNGFHYSYAVTVIGCNNGYVKLCTYRGWYGDAIIFSMPLIEYYIAYKKQKQYEEKFGVEISISQK